MLHHSNIHKCRGYVRPGVLIAVDGPGGVGKSVIVREIAEYLKEIGVPVYTTRQPSTGTLGTYARQHADSFHGMALANLLAADRQYQQETEIEPRLADGNVVLCDRYLPSSLVLQGIDGVSTDTVWALNSGIRVPDASVFLRADPTILPPGYGAGVVLTTDSKRSPATQNGSWRCSTSSPRI